MRSLTAAISPGRLVPIMVVLAAAALALAADTFGLPGLEAVKAQRNALVGLLATDPIAVIGLYFLLFAAFTALSVPGAAMMTLAGGAVFGPWLGLLLASFASALGGLLAFAGSRHLFRRRVERRLGPRLEAIARGMERDGLYYLLALRLNPAVPYFLVNLAMGLTRMPAARFVLASQAGMLPAMFVYAYAGSQLARIREPGDIVSPGLFAALLLVSLLPLLGKWAADRLRRRGARAGMDGRAESG